MRYKNTWIFYFLVTAVVACAVSLTSAYAEKERPDQPAQKIPASGKVTFNFVDVELPTITKFISDITKKNFIFDERVKGKITIIAPAKLNIEEAYNLFTSVLELKGFTIVPSGADAYKIIPSVEARQRGVEVSRDKKPVNEAYIARIIPLNFTSADDALRLIQPIISKDGYIASFGHGNLLLAMDSGLNIEKILAITNLIDQPSNKETPEMVYLKHAGADSVAKIINEGMSKKRAVPKPVALEEARSVADTRLNAVVLFGDKSSRESMKSLIALLDAPSPEAQGRINVYFLENADAADLAKSLESVIKISQSQKQASPAPGAVSVTPFESAGAVNITADKASNSLIIVASPADYQNILQVVKQLDRKRKQVYVEAMIVEASIDKLRELGTKWRATGRHNGEPVIIGGFGTMDSSALQSVISGLEGVTLGGMGNFFNLPLTTIGSDGTATVSNFSIPGFAALFSLNEFKDSVNVLSMPQILTSDNKEAEIVVGENVPFISKRERDLTTSNSVLSSIERKDVGITLKITPQISEGDYVRLDLYQEISSLKNESENVLINIGPTTTKRSTKTSVVVKDRQTVIIGGLMQEKDEENLTKIPVLGDIPLLGILFSHKSTSKKKTNLIVFLTPHIVRESARLMEITKNKQEEFAMSEQMGANRELLVKFKDDVSKKRAEEIISANKAVIVKFIEDAGIYHIRIAEGEDMREAIKKFYLLPEVQYAEPNYTRKIQKTDQK